MKPIRALHVSICTIGCVMAMTAACSSGSAEPTGGSGGGGAGATSTNSTSTGSPTTTSSTSGASSSSGNAKPSVCDNNVHEIPADQGFIDDFETNKQFGGWYAFADTTPAGTTKLVAMVGGAVNTTMAGEVKATGIKAPTDGGFGAGFGYGLKDAAMMCAGVHAFDGVSFWAKGTAGKDNTLRFQAVVAATQAKMDGGDCESNCYNHPGKDITLTDTWKQYTIKWTDLAGAVKVDGVILGLNWITPGPDMDVWIDEVALYAGTAPSGPVGK